MAQRAWIEKTFNKKECVKFIGNVGEPRRCGCGQLFVNHSHLTQTAHVKSASHGKWTVDNHTNSSPTDAYGLLEFQGAGQANKAQYIRLSADTKPESILELFQKEWKLELPKLVISIHGGIQNFALQPKISRVFSKGLQKAAKTTGAWVLTGGTNTGVTVHVGDALNNRSVTMHGRTVTIGIAPWGVLLNRDNLVGRDVVKPYYTVPCPTSKGAILNSSHTHFLLVDNGTVGNYGAEIMQRRRLEKFISQQRISSRSRRCVPVVCVVVEGGPNTIRSVLTMVTDMPPIPIVVCDGSGRAADLLAFVYKFAGDDGTMLDTLRDQLLVIIQQTFLFTRDQAEKLFVELMLCVRRRDLITVFRLGDNESEDIDLSILTALLKSQNSSPLDQLQLALAWDRVDIAKKQVFVYGVEWPEGALEQAMMDALVFDRVEFVRLLMDNGVNIQKFLTFSRLEDLYNAVGPTSRLHYLARDLQKNVHSYSRYTLMDIGFVVEHLMGGAYRSLYTRKKFKAVYQTCMKSQGLKIVASHLSLAGEPEARVNSKTETFTYPFQELMVWAVLMKRHKMALFMWQQGEEAMAKALAASKLYKGMAHDAEHDEIEVDTASKLREYSNEFQNLALKLLEQCYHVNNHLTQQLLTYELKNWSKLTCLSLAVTANHKEFIAHPCCQTLLNDMWMGGLQMRKNTDLKVIMGVLLPPTIMTLEFKSKEQLQLMPQTIEEHYQDLQETVDKTSIHDDMEMDDLISDENRKMMAAGITNVGQKAAMILGVPSSPEAEETNKKSALKSRKKIYEFYNAPVSKFWSHSMAYMVFLIVFNYVVLVRMDEMPNWPEWYVIAYVITFTVEKTRELFLSETGSFSTKVKVFYSDHWNIVDTFGILFFFAGMVIRFIPSILPHGKVVYCVSTVFWYIRLLDLFSVNKYLGPYVTMMSKMVVDMIYICIIFMVLLVSFGVVRQSVKFPNLPFSWTSVKMILLEPYFMLYGEVYAPDIDPECTEDEPDAPQCSTGHWVTPLLMTLYLLVANILLINLLIAVFNNTFEAVNAISRQIWKFQRYRLVMEYEQIAVLAPPIIIISHLYMFIRYLFRRCRKFRPTTLDKGLKLFLSDEDVEKLFDFEEECMEYYFRNEEEMKRTSSEVMVSETHERTEAMALKLEEVNEKNNRTKMSIQSIDQRLVRLEQIALQTVSAVQSMQSLLHQVQVIPVTTEQSVVTSSAQMPHIGQMAVSTMSAGMPSERESFSSASWQTSSEHTVVSGATLKRPIEPMGFNTATQEKSKTAGRKELHGSWSVDSSSSVQSPVSSKRLDSPAKTVSFDSSASRDSEDATPGEGPITLDLDTERVRSSKYKLERQETVFSTGTSKDPSEQTLSPEENPSEKMPKIGKKQRSTFERWASMQESAQSMDSYLSDEEEFQPVRRQISRNTPTATLPKLRMPVDSERASTSRDSHGLVRQVLLGNTGNSLMPRQVDSRRSSDSNMSQFSFAPDDQISRLQIPKPYTSIPTYSSITDAIDTSVVSDSAPASPSLYRPAYHTITESIDTSASDAPVQSNHTSKNPDYDINRYSSRYMIHRFSQDESAYLKLAEQRDYELMENEVHDKLQRAKSSSSLENAKMQRAKSSTSLETQAASGGVEFQLGGRKLKKLKKKEKA
ncbi:transient receptor potential cation channel subfamily M member 3-like isoform X2 [Ptychodera flava]|uniref:transient receptor potential cation channel subfamily M member 3-like isoform X2 n=1 Tax=Ptychodera flava TaxID=63121 RepID=UPI003969EB23